MKSLKNSCFFCLTSLAILTVALIADSVTAEIVYHEKDGVVSGEAELYSGRNHYISGSITNGWLVVPNESDSAGTFTNARGDSFIQCLPDDRSGGGGPLVTPEISYKMKICEPGTYRVYLRWECNKSAGSGETGGGNSDSIFVDLVEFKDGIINPDTYGSSTNAIADWYEFVQNDDGDFSTNPWQSSCRAEENDGGASGHYAEWVISTQGVYTLRFTQREDGAAVDSFVFQKSSLSAPTGDGPAVSSFEQTRIYSEVLHDTYIRRNDTNALHGAETSMLLKNDTSSGPAGYDRTIYLRFDISELSDFADAVPTNATMQIYLTNEGTSTNHNIYVAVIAEDATAETFDEMTLWPSADPPSNNDVFTGATDEGVDFSQIYDGAPVGSFEISSTNENKTISFSSPQFLKAIRDDTDGVLSMVLYRTFDNSNTDSFVSKENATYPAPNIEVNFWYPAMGTMIIVH